MTKDLPVFMGVCNPLLDISAVIEPSLLVKFELKSNDAILAEEKHLPLYKYLVDNYPVKYIAGGAGQNSMRGAQWILPKHSTIFIGCVGDDQEAKQLRENAEKEGLQTEYQISNTKPTGKCAVLITDHNRCLVTDLQAANELNINHFKSPKITEFITHAKFFYVTGFLLTVTPDSVLYLAEHACSNNKTFAMNLSAPFISQFFKEPLDSLSEYWDILFGNESEAQAYADSHGFNSTDLNEIALRISNLPKKNKNKSRIVVITQGKSFIGLLKGTLPTLVAVDNKITEYSIIPVAKVVDTNGAGDGFVGGFMAQYILGKSLEACVKCGHYVASKVIQRDGPTYPEEKAEFDF